MLKRIKKFIHRIKLKIRIRQVEKRVLRFKLYNWQKDVILNGYWGNKNVPLTQRRAGKTLAYDLYFILNDEFEYDTGKPCNTSTNLKLSLNKVSLANEVLIDELSLENSLNYRKWHMREMQSLYMRIKDNAITVRDIKFIWR